MQAFSEELIYKTCLLSERPYFGSHLHATQGLIVRHVFMRSLLLNEVARNQGERVNVLEIGSWAGGSAITWASALKSVGASGRIFCVDPWKPYVGAENIESRDMRAMNEELQNDEIFRLFLHNVRTLGHDDLVIPIRGKSAEVLPCLRPGQFNVVYVDGDHRYDAVLADLTRSSGLVMPGGVLCGDDLELQLSEIDTVEAEKNKGEDYVRDPKTGKFFHPGVTLAVGRSFEKVSVWEGFWAVRKTTEGWQPVEPFNVQDGTAPQHLEPSSVGLTFELTEYLKKRGFL
ncbi:MAG: class I SAM-dependent methyltransferase [Verrucomicrobia bacterium]|nr:class I SAM-dependent methyltransferase [Verrucomicrobiota bacterium]